MDSSPPRARIAIVLVQPGQPADDSLVPDYFRALLTAGTVGAPALAARALLALRTRRLAREFQVDEMTAGAVDPIGYELENALWEFGTVQVFTACLFTAPSLLAAAHEVARFQPDRIVMVPPSPLFSSGLNGLALTQWRRAMAGAGLTAPASSLCCHPTDPPFLRRLAQRAVDAMGATAAPTADGTLLLLAPGTGTGAGDPLAWQMGRLAAELARLLDIRPQRVVSALLPIPGFADSGLPSVDTTLRRLRSSTVTILPLLPWSLLRSTWAEFLPHWRMAAQGSGILSLELADMQPTDGASLAPLVRQALAALPGVCAGFGRRLCPGDLASCPHRRMAVAAMHGAAGA